MATLTSYLTTTRRLLRDAAADFWQDGELTDYINSARQRVVRDSGCKRMLQSYTLPANTATVLYTALPQAGRTIDIVNINVLWATNNLPPLSRLPWTAFNTWIRQVPAQRRVPGFYSIYGGNTIYFGPVPDIDYALELDTVVLPVDLTSAAPTEADIPHPFIDPVPYYAAHLAQYNQQAYDKAEIMKQEYLRQVLSSLSASMTRSTTYPYRRP